MSAMRVSELIKGFGPFTSPLHRGSSCDYQSIKRKN
uniref:Uncharacterized protein n=1 Tax=Myoviridae sp. ct5Xl4 TaxID=2826613 RepID=A0A8S5M1H9_9CAUD|nr:MAG TPA: hypothetical protein [Myoviridae sp. ct5Xl4]